MALETVKKQNKSKTRDNLEINCGPGASSQKLCVLPLVVVLWNCTAGSCDPQHLIFRLGQRMHPFSYKNL